MTRPIFRLSDEELRVLASALRTGRVGPPFTSFSLQRFLPTSGAEDLAADLQALSAGRGVDVASALELLVEDRAQRKSPQVEIVSTGPSTAAVPNRDTGVVVRELFLSADRHLLVTGYTVRQGQEIFRALAEHMSRRPGLDVILCLDVAPKSGDSSSQDQIVARFAHDFCTQQWPEGAPLPRVYYDPRALHPEPRKRASLHAKCVVADRTRAFVSSANLTGAAQQRNIELGLLLTSPTLAERIVRHFEGLIGCRLLLDLPLPRQDTTS